MADQWFAGLAPAAAAELRGGFDDDAEVYQRTRPVCPPKLFDDLMRLARLAPGDRVLEIAPGTGQATVPLAERGLAITAVELGASLAAVARRRLARIPAVEVVTSAFEDWQPPDDAPWNAVIVFNALHWIDPDVQYAKPCCPGDCRQSPVLRRPFRESRVYTTVCALPPPRFHPVLNLAVGETEPLSLFPGDDSFLDAY